MVIVLYESKLTEYSHTSHLFTIFSEVKMDLHKNLGSPELRLVQFAEITPLFTVDDLRTRYGRATSDRTIFNMLNRLKKQGRVRTLTSGVYSGALSSGPSSRYEVPGKLRPDAVIACHSALELHGVAN